MGKTKMTNKERKRLWWTTLKFKHKKRKITTAQGRLTLEESVACLSILDGSVVIMLILLMGTKVQAASLHQPQRVTWILLSTGIGGILNQTSQMSIPSVV